MSPPRRALQRPQECEVRRGLSWPCVGHMGTACSSGPKSPRVASLGKAPSTTVPAPAAQPPIDPATFMAKLLAYTHCMRSHGIADFPDPTPSPAPTGKAAASALRPALAATSTPTTSATRPPTVLARRSCPSEGLSHLPVPLKWRSTQSSQPVPVGTGSPVFQTLNGQGVFVLHNLDLGSPQFQSAEKTCRSVVHLSGPLRVDATNTGPNAPA